MSNVLLDEVLKYILHPLFLSIVFLIFLIKARNKILKLISNPHFPILYSVISILLIILRILSIFISELNFLNPYLLISVFCTLIISIFTLIYQTQRVDIVIYPPILRIIESENDDDGSYYGIKDLNTEKEKPIEVLFLKTGNLKIFLDNMIVSFPKYGTLTCIKTSFVRDNEISTIGFKNKKEIETGKPISINEKINGFAANYYEYRIYNKPNFIGETSEEIYIKLNYSIHFCSLKFEVSKVKVAKINAY